MIARQDGATGRPVRLMHTMLRVGDLDRSVAFYRLLGMGEHRRHVFPEGRFSIAMVGYGDEASESALELTHNWDTPAYDLGAGYGHIALATHDVHGLCERLAAAGVSIARAPGPMKGGPTLAFVTDPDGYRIELIEIDEAHPLGRYEAPLAPPASGA